MTGRVQAAVFAREADLLAAARAARSRGLAIVDVHSPYPLHGIDEVAGIRRTRISAVCLAGGVAGLSLGLWLQHWTSAVDWPLNVGGKPWNSLPAFLPVAFELTVLVAGLSTVAALLVRSRLHPRRSPRLAGLGTSDDRFALVVARTPDGPTDREMAAFWRGLGAERTLDVEVAQ